MRKAIRKLVSVLLVITLVIPAAAFAAELPQPIVKEDIALGYGQDSEYYGECENNLPDPSISDGYITILIAAELDAVRRNLGGSFRLGADIDLSGFANWQPIKNFTGSFDGNGFTISGLSINRTTTSNIGLFGSINNANIRNLTVELGGDIF